jgi:hypothetical protein
LKILKYRKEELQVHLDKKGRPTPVEPAPSSPQALQWNPEIERLKKTEQGKKNDPLGVILSRLGTG